ncbi:MAG: SIS domain-containing protein, partial [Alphaproteobacteria bacterium]
MSGVAQASERPEAESARDLESARRVFRLEAEGIQSLARALEGPLGAALTRAIDLIRGAGGRVIVTGMGKNSHVARKVAATMASVGTPAQFVHPAEASHGDLGMIARNDAVIALSNS